MEPYLLSERLGVILNPELPIFFHAMKPFHNLTWKIPIFVSHFLSLPPLNLPTPSTSTYQLMNCCVWGRWERKTGWLQADSGATSPVSKTPAPVAQAANLSQPASNKGPHLVLRSQVEGWCAQTMLDLSSVVYALSF